MGSGGARTISPGRSDIDSVVTSVCTAMNCRSFPCGAHHEQSTIAPVTQHASVEQTCAHGVRGRTVAGRACESQIGEMVIWFRKAVPSFR